MSRPPTYHQRGFRAYGCLIQPENMQQQILVSVGTHNAYRRRVWRVTTPDGRWIRLGTQRTAIRWAAANARRFQKELADV